MPSLTLNPNISFRLSGINLGNYTFEQNPESMNVVPPTQTYNVLRTLQGNDVYQRSLRDNEARVMTWTRASTSLYANLKTYGTLDVNGNIPVSYLWDGTVKEMQGVAVQVLDVHGEPIAADYSLVKISLKYKPVTYFDKLYKCLNTIQGNSNLPSPGNGIYGPRGLTFGAASYGGAYALQGLKVKVPDSTYTIQAYDGSFNSLLTPSSYTFNSNTNEYTVTIASVPNASTASTLLTFKNGWVTSKCSLNGLLDGAYFQLI